MICLDTGEEFYSSFDRETGVFIDNFMFTNLQTYFYMSIYESLLYDIDDKVRMESPEIFRVLGKRRPEFVRPFLEQLQKIAETDSNRVVRIHSLGAIKATKSK